MYIKGFLVTVSSLRNVLLSFIHHYIRYQYHHQFINPHLPVPCPVHPVPVPVPVPVSFSPYPLPFSLVILFPYLASFPSLSPGPAFVSQSSTSSIPSESR